MIRIDERENTLEISERKWLECTDKHQIKYSKKDYTVGNFSTRLCYLQNANELTVRGAGKGRNSAEINISASYEALEFYLSGYRYRPYPLEIKSLKAIASQHDPLFFRCNTAMFIKEAKDHCLPWVFFQDLKTAKQYAVPLKSVDLSYQTPLFKEDKLNYHLCSFYAASNGLASGTTYEESLIHGIIEVLERDAYSYFLIDTFILRKSPILIDKQSLPEDLINLIIQIETNYQNEVILIKMPSRFGIHVYLACFMFMDKEFEIQSRGFGASLNAKYALERAIYELIQTYNLNHGYFIANNLNKKLISNNSLIKKIVALNLAKGIKFSSKNVINFNDNSNEFEKLPLSEYLGKLIELVYKHSDSLLVNQVYQDQNGLTCLRVIIPEAEEFFLTTHYLKLELKPETEIYIHSQLGKKFNWDDYNKTRR